MNHQHSHDKRADILEAAHRRFARFGLAKVTMDEIAADLGISKAALYYYFPAKEDVFRNVVAAEQQDFAKRIEAIIEGDSEAPGKLREYFKQHLALLGTLLDLDEQEIRSSRSCGICSANSARQRRISYGHFERRQAPQRIAVDSSEQTAQLIQHVLQGCGIRFFKTMTPGELRSADIQSYRDEVLRFLDILLIGISHSRNGVKKI